MKNTITQITLTNSTESVERTVPQYEADDGPLTAEQISQIQNAAPKAQGGTIKSTFFPLSSLHD